MCFDPWFSYILQLTVTPCVGVWIETRIKMFLILEACQKNKQVVRGGIAS